MNGIALVSLIAFPHFHLAELSKATFEVRHRTFAMPIAYDPSQRDDIAWMRIYVSSDGGGTWSRHKDLDSKDKKVSFAAPQDGLYCFAVQVMGKDGTCDPPTISDLTPQMKVYVNTRGSTVALKPSREELEREVERLKARIAELGSDVASLKANSHRK